MTPVIYAHQLKKSFYSHAQLDVLKGIDLIVHPGESIAITGKSGEGKSTLLHILGTLDTPSAGRLEICGKDTKTCDITKLRNQNIGFVFQTHHLLDEYTLLENVLMPAKIARQPTYPGSPAYERAMTLLEQVGLKQRIAFYAKLLSGGEKQRAAIARALCNDPMLLLADEPSGNLDHTHSQEIHSLLIQLAHQFSKTLIVVTHATELANLCDRILLLKDGILLDG